MHVTVPLSWLKHPFLKNAFVIKSQDQIDKLIAHGITEVVIDRSREEQIAGAPARQTVGTSDPAWTPPRTWNPATLVPPELPEAIHDSSLSPEKRSRLVYASSRVLVERLFEDPKAENIREAKRGIADIVDMIIADDATSSAMLKITTHDFYTYTHSVNVGVFAIMLAKALFRGSDAHDMHELGAGLFLHDIGKVHIDPGIINKPGRLTDDEWGIIRSHPDRGYQILKDTEQLSTECMLIVMQHHEREDGTGYPLGLKGNEIHTYGRICCIADVYDALTAERSYKQRLSPFVALTLMKEQMLDHFRKDMFETFVRLFTE